MSTDKNKQHELSHILVDLLEGTIDEERFNQLQNQIANDQSGLAYYVEFMALWAYLDQICDTSDMSSPDPTELNDPLTAALLREAIEHDEKVRADKAAEEASRQAAVRKAQVEKEAAKAFKEFKEQERRRQEKLAYKRYKARQRKLIFGITSLAASLIFVVSAWIIHNKSKPSVISSPALTIVAQLTDELGAIWDRTKQIPDEDGQMRQSTYRLNAGYVSILFHGGVKITVEAPAELSLFGGGNMELFRGRIYAVVPEEAHGFTVMAGNSKVVDLGTEFGVEVDEKNNTQLHVIKGRTMLFTGLLTGKKSQVNVDEGTAKNVNRDGLVTNVPVVKKKFVRRINAKSNFIWKGQSDLLSELPDVIVVDGAIMSLTFAGRDYVVADGDLVVGTTTRWANGKQVVDPAPPAVDIGANADNFLFESVIDGARHTDISSLDGLDYQETVFPFLVSAIFVFERGGNDNGTVQAILADGSLGAALTLTGGGAPYADTGISVLDRKGQSQNAYGYVLTTDVPIKGLRITATKHDSLSISAPNQEPALNR